MTYFKACSWLVLCAGFGFFVVFQRSILRVVLLIFSLFKELFGTFCDLFKMALMVVLLPICGRFSELICGCI